MKCFLALVLVFACGCGVKGKPLPPLQPVKPGDGKLRAQDDEKEKTQRPTASPEIPAS